MYDGSVYIGTIIAEDAFEITMETDMLGTLQIPKHSVKNRRLGADIILVDKGKFHKKSGMFLAIESTNSFGANDNYFQQFSLTYGKRFTPKLIFGAGLAISWSNINQPSVWVDQTFLQPYAFGRYYINDKNIRWFVDTKLGYGFQQQSWQETTNGIFAMPSIGFEIANKKNMKWSFKLSQYIQQTGFSRDWVDLFTNPVRVDADVIYNRTSLTIGINF